MKHGESIAYHLVLALLSLAILIFIILFIFIIWKNKKVTNSNGTVYDQKSDQESPSIKLCASPYTLVDIDVATDGFNERRIIGKGRLGTVYAAVLAGGELVAVKRIYPRFVLRSSGLGAGASLGFSSILKWLSLANHPNVLSILGFSEGPGERIVVMEFMGMMSLDFYLHQNLDGASLLDWGRRLRVAAGVARGLEYLHELVAPSIIHGCVKPSNILIDVKFSAKICDYGLSFLAPNEKEGLMGYVDHEYWIEPKGASKESDVYGLGVVLLELLSGRRSDGGLIVKWGLPLIKDMKIDEILDPRLVVPSDIKPLVRLAKVASACVSNSRKNRPLIGQVAAILNDLQDEVMLWSNGSF